MSLYLYRPGPPGYDPTDPVQRAEIAWDLPPAMARTALHFLAWRHPETFAEAVAEAFADAGELARFAARDDG